MLVWFAKLRFAQVLAVAIVWPLLLVIGAAAVALAKLWPHVQAGDPYFVDVRRGPLLLVMLFGPSTVILALWAIARWRRGAAT